MILRDEGRFRALLDGAPTAAVWDTVVAEADEFVIAPTKGSIVPGWLLVVPRRHVLNVATLAGEDGWAGAIVPLACDAIGVSPSRVIWFEHGAAEVGSTVGCGVDHAHLHLLVDPQFDVHEFRSVVATASEAVWHEVSPYRPFDYTDGRTSYYVFGNHETAWMTEGVNLGSQFFRRVIADLVGRSDEWDYKIHDGADRVVETLRCMAADVVKAA